MLANRASGKSSRSSRIQSTTNLRLREVTMKVARFRIAGLTVAVAIAALIFGAIRAITVLDNQRKSESLVVGALPMANVLAVGMLIGQRRPAGHRPRFVESERTDQPLESLPLQYAAQRRWAGTPERAGQVVGHRSSRHAGRRHWPGASGGSDQARVLQPQQNSGYRRWSERASKGIPDAEDLALSSGPAGA